MKALYKEEFVKMVLFSWQCIRKFEEHGRSHLNIILRERFISQITLSPLRTKDQSPVTLNNSTVSAHKSSLTSVSLRNLRHSRVWHQNFLFHPVKEKNEDDTQNSVIQGLPACRIQKMLEGRME